MDPGEAEKLSRSSAEPRSEAEAGRHIFRAGSSLPEDKIIQLRSQLCIVEHNGELYGVNPEVLLDSFAELPLKTVESEHGTIPLGPEIQALCALTKAAIPELITTVGAYNIVRYDGIFYVLPHSLGEVRWGEEDVASLPGVVTAPKLSEALGRATKKVGILQRVRQTVTNWSVVSKPDLSSPSSSPPRLVGSVQHYNIVHYNGWFYGIPQQLGKMDLQVTDPMGLPGVLRTLSRDETEQQIHQLLQGVTPATNQPRLIGTVEDYNVIEYEGWFYGVPQALGEIDLSKTDVIEMPGVVRDETRTVVENEIREIFRKTKVNVGDEGSDPSSPTFE